MTNQEVVRECARYRRRAVEAERRAEALDAELVLVREERDTEKARREQAEKDRDNWLRKVCEIENALEGLPADTVIGTVQTLRAEVGRLQAIVDRLPKTADGAPVTDDMVTFCGHRPPFPHLWRLRAHDGESYGVHAEGEPQYSTREAAMAASEEPKS